MSKPIISMESIRRLRLQNTRYRRATSIPVCTSPSSALTSASVSRADTIRTNCNRVPRMLNREPDPFVELLSAEVIARRVAELGAQITADYRGKDGVVVLGVLKGSVLFMADLVRAIELPVLMDFIGVASYGDATTSSGVVRITQDLSKPVEGKHVLVIEDIVDTG